MIQNAENCHGNSLSLMREPLPSVHRLVFASVDVIRKGEASDDRPPGIHRNMQPSIPWPSLPDAVQGDWRQALIGWLSVRPQSGLQMPGDESERRMNISPPRCVSVRLTAHFELGSLPLRPAPSASQ